MIGLKENSQKTDRKGTGIMKENRYELNKQLAQMLKGGVIMDVTTPEQAKIAEEAGACAVMALERIPADIRAAGGVSRMSDPKMIRGIQEAVSIPVMGNGDVIDAVSCKRMYEETGVDFVMIGRGAQGRPWVFKQIAHYMQTGELLPDPTLEEKMDILLRHIRLSCDYKGEKIGMREARKHAAWYFKGEYGSADFRRRAGQLCTYDDLQRLAEEMLNSRHHA